MSLQRAGVWAAEVWAPTVWADGVWYETAAPTPTPSGGGGGVVRRRVRGRGQSFAEPATLPLVIVYGRMLVMDEDDDFNAAGICYESETQITARRNARTLAMLMLS